MNEFFGTIIGAIAGTIIVMALLVFPSLLAGLTLWVTWNYLLGAFLSASLPQVGFLHCWATAFCSGWFIRFLIGTNNNSERKE